jgi:hypothetical protein
MSGCVLKELQILLDWGQEKIYRVVDVADGSISQGSDKIV